MKVHIDKVHRINGEYKVHDQIGIGSFSAVYMVVDRNGRKRAAKFVNVEHKERLERETKVMTNASGRRKYGTLYWHFFGRHGRSYVMVMDLLGTSVLRTPRVHCKISAVLKIGIEAIRRLRQLHQHGYIHGNITPHHLHIGRSKVDSKYVYLTGYRFARKYRDSGNRHLPPAFESYSPCAKAFDRKFASKEAHRGWSQCRKSDLESLLYSMIFLIRLHLPWESSNAETTRALKEGTPVGSLFYGLPPQLKYYNREVSRLGYAENPNYMKLIYFLSEALLHYDDGADYMMADNDFSVDSDTDKSE